MAASTLLTEEEFLSLPESAGKQGVFRKDSALRVDARSAYECALFPVKVAPQDRSPVE